MAQVSTPRKSRPVGAADDRAAVSTRAVDRALALLAALVGRGEPPALSNLAHETGLALSTVLRLLRTLEGARFVRRDGAGRYHPGARLLQVGVLAMRRVPVFEVALTTLPDLVNDTGETAHLAILDDAGRVLYLHHSPSPRAIRHVGWRGGPFAPEGTAIGEALLGRVGTRGFVASRKTLEPDVTAVAAPIYGPAGDIVAGLSVTGPSYRISDADIERLARAVVRRAADISASLGATRVAA